MKREILIAGGLAAALATAAFVRPPRTVPAFSPVVMTTETTCRGSSCHPEPFGSAALRSGQAESKGARHARHLRASHERRGSTRSHFRKHIDLVDVNRANAAMLASVPGITPDLARRIVAYRALVGPFATLDDLSDLDGLSEGRLISLGRYLIVR